MPGPPARPPGGRNIAGNIEIKISCLIILEQGMTPATQKTEQRIKDLADIMDKPITELLTPLEITETAEMNIQPEDQVYLFTWNPNDRKISPHA